MITLIIYFAYKFKDLFDKSDFGEDVVEGIDELS